MKWESFTIVYPPPEFHSQLLSDFMIEYSGTEKKFLQRMKYSIFATSTKRGISQATPMDFYFNSGNFYFATKPNNKKMRNIHDNPWVSIAIGPHRDSDTEEHRQPKTISIQGIVEIIEDGMEFDIASRELSKKYGYFRANPIRKHESLILKVVPRTKFSYGIK